MKQELMEKLKTVPTGGRICVLSGAGMSAESGISTFRDSGGIWEKYDIYEVATPQAWEKDHEMVLRFYNERRKQLLQVKPNEAHRALVKLEEKYDVQIITQNIDDLHERAGSSRVLHLHGELRKARSCVDESLVYEVNGWEIKPGDRCEKGSQLRPHVVWFGEPVPMIENAMELVRQSDLVIVIGTSLNVYPAAGLLYDVPQNAPVVAIDPAPLDLRAFTNIIHLQEKAGKGMKELLDVLLNNLHPL